MGAEQPRGPGRAGHQWRKARARVLRNYDACWLCGEIVDKAAPYRDPQTGLVNGNSASVDHVQPLTMGGDPLDPANLRLAHNRCNVSRGSGGPVKVVSEDW